MCLSLPRYVFSWQLHSLDYSRNDELEVGELVDVENDPRGVAEEEDEHDAEQDEALEAIV